MATATASADWVKYPEEITIEGVSWTLMTGSNSITGDVTVEVLGDPELSAEVLSTTNKLSTVRLTGGTEGRAAQLVFTLVVGAQTLQAVKGFRTLKY